MLCEWIIIGLLSECNIREDKQVVKQSRSGSTFRRTPSSVVVVSCECVTIFLSGRVCVVKCELTSRVCFIQRKYL
jgi:hypothetical protein